MSIDTKIELNKHAYLISVDNSFTDEKLLDIIKQMAYDDLKGKDLDNILNLLNNNCYPDLKFILPDGKTIKKEQISSLISDFENKSLYEWKKIYVVKYAENLNQSSANSLLKFLEEPEDGIVALLLTKDITNVIETIISRCELINLNHYKSKSFPQELIENSIGFLLRLESKDNSIAYETDIYSLKADELLNIFEVLFYLYDDIVYYNYFKTVTCFPEHIDIIKSFTEKSNLCDIIKKSKKINKIKQLLEFNVNTRICLDLLFVGDIDEI